MTNPTFAGTTVGLLASYPFVERGVDLRHKFRIYNNRGPSPENGQPNLQIADLLPHTYPSYEAAFSGKNLDFVPGSVSSFMPPVERKADLSREFTEDSRRPLCRRSVPAGQHADRRRLPAGGGRVHPRATAGA